jgi:hypothetical protein
MNRWICPVSTEQIDHAGVRTTGFLMAMMLLTYAATGLVALVAIAAADYALRAFFPARYSPVSRLSLGIATRAGTAGRLIDRAPKVFAARLGFVLALTSLLLHMISPAASVVVAVILSGFALLESLGDICVGCLIYAHVVYPVFGDG